MRFTSVSLLALPLLTVAAQESPLDQAKAQAQYWFNKIASYIPTPSVPEPAAAATTKPTVRPLHVLTLDNWKETIQSSVQLDSATPEEWWVFLTGGNKTCFGRCQGPETAFNETASLWASDPKAPHLGYIDCESQAVLCNSWGTGPLTLWIMEVPTPPAPVDIHVWNVNATTTTIKTFQDLRNSREWKEKPAYEGYYFHPFNGLLAQYNLAVPLGYFFWVFSVVPSWLFMIVISFFSRRMVNNRVGPTAPPAGAQRPAAPRQ